MATFKRRTDNREENYLQEKPLIQGLWGELGRSTRWTSLLQTCRIVIQGMKSFKLTGDFWSIAPLSQAKFDRAASTSMPAFRDDVDNAHAINFLNNYQQSVQKGLISEDDRVGPDKMSYIATQPANMASNDSSPETAGKFPGASGVKI